MCYFFLKKKMPIFNLHPYTNFAIIKVSALVKDGITALLASSVFVLFNC